MTRRNIRLAAALAIAGIFVPAAARADDESTSHDVQCFLVTSMLVQSDNERERSAGLMGALFFAGKIFGSDPYIDLAAATRAELPFLTASRRESLRAECGAEMTSRGGDITEAGEGLEDEGPIDIMS